MGFFGLSSWVESDMAADFHGDLVDAVMKATKKELKSEYKYFDYNTPNYINIALMIEDGVYDFMTDYDIQENQDTFLQVYDKLKQLKTSDESSDGLDDDIERLKKSTEKFLRKNKII